MRKGIIEERGGERERRDNELKSLCYLMKMLTMREFTIQYFLYWRGRKMREDSIEGERGGERDE